MRGNSASGSSENVTADEELSYLAEKMRQELAHREAAQFLKGIKKRAKTIGVNVKAADFVERQARQGDKGRVHVWDIIRISLETGLLASDELHQLADSNVRPSEQAVQAHLLAKALVSGWEDGQGGIPQEDNRYEPGSETATKWAEGWSRGDAAHQQLELSLGGKVASTRKEMPTARRERKSVSVVSEHSNGNGSVLPNVKRRGRPPGAKNKPKVVEEHSVAA